jgi:L-alanine-DL-glutamate epimerase-like enolase superfamily enzyme
MSEGYITPSSRAGLGIDLDETKMRFYASKATGFA